MSTDASDQSTGGDLLPVSGPPNGDLPELPGLEWEALLRPFPGDNPAGQDGRRTSGSAHGRILSMLRQADLDRTFNWWDIIREATLALATGGKKLTDGKDLEIVVWLVKALIKVHGFSGLGPGLRLIREYHRSFWQTMYPKANEDPDLAVRADDPVRSEDIEDRASLLRRLDRYLNEDLRLVPLAPSANGTTLHYNAWEGAETDEMKADLDAVATGAGIAHIQALLTSLAYGEKEFAALTASLADQYGPKLSPEMSQGSQAISDCKVHLQRLAWLASPVVAVTAETPAPSTSQASSVAPANPRKVPFATTRYKPRDRIEAVQLLADAAGFLHRLEPLSPVPYQVYKAIRWAHMSSLGDWLKEMISPPRGEALAALYHDLGLDESAPKGGSRNVPLDRGDALQMIWDAASFLQTTEPLSPIPILLQRAVRWGCEATFEGWLHEVLAGQEEPLRHISSILGIGSTSN